MKFCISGHQPKPILEQADEIKINLSDIDKLYDFYIDFPTKTYIIIIPFENISQNIWYKLQKHSQGIKIKICTNKLSVIKQAQSYDLLAYLSYPVISFFELQALLNLKVSDILIDGVLFFKIPQVSQICNNSTNLRIVVNQCYPNYIPSLENGICGTFIRPEDIPIYESYIHICEFDAPNGLNQEAALLEIYKRQYWNDNLNFICTNLDYDINNTLIQPNFAKNRLNCGQICMENKMCHLCPCIFQFYQQIGEKK